MTIAHKYRIIRDDVVRAHRSQEPKETMEIDPAIPLLVQPTLTLVRGHRQMGATLRAEAGSQRHGSVDPRASVTASSHQLPSAEIRGDTRKGAVALVVRSLRGPEQQSIQILPPASRRQEAPAAVLALRGPDCV